MPFAIGRTTSRPSRVLPDGLNDPAHLHGRFRAKLGSLQVAVPARHCSATHGPRSFVGLRTAAPMWKGFCHPSGFFPSSPKFALPDPALLRLFTLFEKNQAEGHFARVKTPCVQRLHRSSSYASEERVTIQIAVEKTPRRPKKTTAKPHQNKPQTKTQPPKHKLQPGV